MPVGGYEAIEAPSVAPIAPPPGGMDMAGAKNLTTNLSRTPAPTPSGDYNPTNQLVGPMQPAAPVVEIPNDMYGNPYQLNPETGAYQSANYRDPNAALPPVGEAGRGRVDKTVPTAGVQAPTVAGTSSSSSTTTRSGTPSPTFAPREIAPLETVAGQMAVLNADGSPYITAGQTAAAQYANSRGLVNSTMAAEAGEVARIKSSLDIARPDAATYVGAASSAQDANQTAGLEGYRGDITSTLNEQEGGIEAGHIAQRGGITSALSAQDAAQRGELSGQNAEQAMALEAFAQDRLDTKEDRETFLAMTTGVQQKHQDALLAIQLAPDSEMDVDAKEAAIDTLNTSTQSQIDMVAAIYEVPITWSTGITDAGIATAGLRVDEEQDAADQAERDAQDKDEKKDMVVDPGGAAVDWLAEEIGVDKPGDVLPDHLTPTGLINKIF